jgi:NAD+ synthase (glutamine-hydrolysing)
MFMKCKTAVAQIDCRVGDIAHNLERHLQYIDKAIAQGVQLIVFPELSLTGYSLRDLAWDVAIDPFTSDFLKPLFDRSKKISLVIGFVETGSNHGIYNSAMFVEDGVVKSIHRKVYPPTYGMFEEGRYFSAGKRVAAFDSKLGRFGILICEDLWHVSLPYAIAMDGAEAILCLTASPTRLSGENNQFDNQVVNYEHHRTYARLLSTYLVFSNRVGFEDGVNFWGGSNITAPGGEMIAFAPLQEEHLIVAELNSIEVQRARRFSRHFLDEQPELILETLRRQSK